MKKDKTFGERIKTIFREQGTTIVSILLALGAVIATIVSWVTKGTGAAVARGGGKSGRDGSGEGSGVKDWAKKQLFALGRALAWLAGKAAGALPGIIGSLVNWLLTC